MTMQAKIWVGQPPHDYRQTRVWMRERKFHKEERGSPYIRADIAEELARALDMAIENARDDSVYVWGEVFRIRDKYRAITH